MGGFSIIICCYNSEGRIEETLQFVFALTVPPNEICEVLIINNNSSDDTVAVARGIESRFNTKKFPFKIIDEPTPGLSSARNTGVNKSSHDIVIFCDDDNHLSPDYLIKASEILEAHPEVAIVGGYAKPKFNISGRNWLIDFFPAMAVGPQAHSDGYVNWVYGAGMILRKKIFEILKKRNIRFLLSDRKGKTLSSGGDAEICCLAIFLGFRIYYCSDLILFHAIPSYRLKKNHYLRAKMNTISPSIYLYILDKLIYNKRDGARSLYFNKILLAIKNILYFSPRLILGKHQFYSFFMWFRTWQTLIWLVFYPNKFGKLYNDIVTNLSIKSKNGQT